MNAPSLAEKVVALHAGLDEAMIGHAFGGALALAYLTRDPRATKDIDVNVFAPVGEVERVLAALPPGVSRSADDVAAVRRDAQVRLWWDHTPVDMFFAVDAIHRQAEVRSRTVPFARIEIPVLDGNELTVFKMMFSRPKDWLDIEEMLRAGAIDVDAVCTAFGRIMGPDHAANARLRTIESAVRSESRGD